MFDPDGKVVYPITLEKQTKVLKNDGVIPDDEIEYWNDIFNRKKLVHLDDLNVIINRYSKLLNKNETKIVSHNGICMLRIPSNRFQIKLVDKSKILILVILQTSKRMEFSLLCQWQTL